MVAHKCIVDDAELIDYLVFKEIMILMHPLPLTSRDNTQWFGREICVTSPNYGRIQDLDSPTVEPVKV